MHTRTFATLVMLFFAMAAGSVGASASPDGNDAFLGRWDITATGTKSGLPRNCWLELRRDEGVLRGRFNPGGGAVFDLPRVTIENGELKFQYPADESEPPQVWRGTVAGSRLRGTALVRGETLTWNGVRGPAWPATPPHRKPGTPIDLFNG